MWGLFVGLAMGMLQVAALSALSRMILGGKPAARMLGALLLVVKIAVIVLILYLISTISLMHLIWTAVGILIGLMLASAAILIRRRKEDAGAGSHTDGKDNRDG